MSPHDRSLLEYLSRLLTPQRRERFAQVLDRRTRHLTVVLEGIYQVFNISAVLRSCDGFGVQDVHVVENRNRLEVNAEIALGAQKWLTIHRYPGAADHSRDCLDTLRSRGYRIVATSPHAGGCLLPDFDCTQPTALLFGNEKDGLLPATLEAADAHVAIPMAGFVESFNLSVAAALCLYQLSLRLRDSDVDWRLSQAERDDLLLAWTRASIPAIDAVEHRYHAECSPAVPGRLAGGEYRILG